MCTGIHIGSKEGDIFYGRTMDLALGMFGEDGSPLPSAILTIPAGAYCESPLEGWTAKYSAMGIGTIDSPILYDGLNEKGLAGDYQVLMECTHDTPENIKERGLIPIIAEEFVTFVLTQYASVEEIKADYDKFAMADIPYNYKGTDFQFPLHFTFVDKTGEAIVLEPVDKGAFKMYESLGVVANSPEYDYHQTNIRNYINLSKYNAPSERKINDNYTMKAIEGGTGYGMFGLPGDYTSPSRFVRAAALSNSLDVFDSQDGINQLYTVFKTVMIPRGLEHPVEEPTHITDYTRYWSGYDLSNKTVYIQTGNGLAITTKTLDPEGDEITYTEVESQIPVAHAK